MAAFKLPDNAEASICGCLLLCPETKDMTSADFYQLTEFIFDLPEVKKYMERFKS